MRKTILVLILAIGLLTGLALAGDWHINFKLNNDNTTQLQNEEQVVVNPNNPNHVVAVWRDFRLGWREVAFATTLDQWRTVARETLFYAHNGTQYTLDSDPGLTVDANGNFYVVILSFISTSQPNALYVKKSTDGGLNWGPNVTVVDNVSGYFEDKELIACDRTASSYRGYVYVTWARFGAGEQVMLCRSTNGGASFSAPLAVTSMSSLQWPVPTVGPNGELYIAWDAFSAIQFSKSTNGGVTFNGTHTLQNVGFGYGYINGSIGTFSYPAIDVDISSGPRRGWVYCVYEDYEQGSTSCLDMYFTRSTDGGTTWTSPLRINDDTLGNGRDQFHPWMTVDLQGTIHACWLDRRLDPANMMMDCYYTCSSDGGTTWAKNQRVSTVSSDPRLFFKEGERRWKPGMPLADALLSEHLGEYIGLAAADHFHVYPVWTDCRNGNQDAFGARPDSLSGVWEEVRPAQREPERSGLAAFPNPARKGCDIRFAFSTEAPVRLSIYDVSGQAVRSFSSHFLRLTSHSLFWDGRDESGIEVPSGIYLLRAEAGKESVTGRVVVAR